MIGKEYLEARLREMGAQPDENVKDVWWFNGDCFIIKQTPEGVWTLEEL